MEKRTEQYDKILNMVTEGMEKVHSTYMEELDKAASGKRAEVTKDYAMAMMGFATLMSSLGMLRPYTPWANMAMGCTCTDKS